MLAEGGTDKELESAVEFGRIERNQELFGVADLPLSVWCLERPKLLQSIREDIIQTIVVDFLELLVADDHALVVLGSGHMERGLEAPIMENDEALAAYKLNRRPRSTA